MEAGAERGDEAKHGRWCTGLAPPSLGGHVDAAYIVLKVTRNHCVFKASHLCSSKSQNLIAFQTEKSHLSL